MDCIVDGNIDSIWERYDNFLKTEQKKKNMHPVLVPQFVH